MQQVSINNNPTIWDTESNPSVVKICYLNTRSLVNKFDNIILDSSLQQSDVLVLAETWIPEKTDMCNKFKLKNHMSHLNCSGRGKGLAIFQKSESNPITDHNETDINISKIECEDIDVIAIYRSKEGSMGKLKQKLESIINMSKSVLIVGDMNICNRKMPKNE